MLDAQSSLQTTAVRYASTGVTTIKNNLQRKRYEETIRELEPLDGYAPGTGHMEAPSRCVLRIGALVTSSLATFGSSIYLVVVLPRLTVRKHGDDLEESCTGRNEFFLSESDHVQCCERSNMVLSDAMVHFGDLASWHLDR